VIHVYAIVRELDDLPALHGLDDAALERARIEGFDVVMSRTQQKTIEPSDEAVVRHAEVIEALQMRSEAILPARFGDGFSDNEDLVTAVRSKRIQLERGLTRVRGCVEFGVRVVLSEREAVEEGPIRSGRDYMGLRLEQAIKRRVLARQIDEPLARLAMATTRGDPSTPDILLTAAYLVPVPAAELFQLEVQRLQALLADLDILCTGPWPPYSFAADAEADG
jgi:Gas vesicle synthesis protein GvpL/GvpF